uniref:Uncharacterized protein n=1 Tax=Oryza meridionalis TaxID=40149 RepID=A0A0E0D8C1_9ORYZ
MASEDKFDVLLRRIEEFERRRVEADQRRSADLLSLKAVVESWTPKVQKNAEDLQILVGDKQSKVTPIMSSPAAATRSPWRDGTAGLHRYRRHGQGRRGGRPWQRGATSLREREGELGRGETLYQWEGEEEKEKGLLSCCPLNTGRLVSLVLSFSLCCEALKPTKRNRLSPVLQHSAAVDPLCQTK